MLSPTHRHPTVSRRSCDLHVFPHIIQGGMGVAVSGWRLAKAVAKCGELGVVSSTGIGYVFLARLWEGDEGGHLRRALATFPDQEAAKGLLDKYLGGQLVDGAPKYPYVRHPAVAPTLEQNRIDVMANYCEVWLAKEGHHGWVGINLMEKAQLTNLPSLFGALLAGVDVVFMGAGIPFRIPGVLLGLAGYAAVEYPIHVTGADKDETFATRFAPGEVFSLSAGRWPAIQVPLFFPVISSLVLAKALVKRADGVVDGFIVEGHSAGGHSAPPRGAGPAVPGVAPAYGPKDDVDIAGLAKLGLPFFLAGNQADPSALEQAQAKGAHGIQVGTAFAFCDESGFREDLKAEVRRQAVAGTLDVRADARASPTGFPFKVVQLKGTVSDAAVVEERERLCDLGMLRETYRKEGGGVGYRCPAEPEEHYQRKGGHADDTIGRVCLCNSLLSSCGVVRQRMDGYEEPALVTAGLSAAHIADLVDEVTGRYSAVDVIRHLRAH